MCNKWQMTHNAIEIAATLSTNSSSISHLDLEKSSTQIYYWVVILTGVFTAVTFVWKWLSKFFRAIKNKYIYLEQSLDKIEIISKEFQPNHGSSLKDHLNKISTELTKNTELTEKIATRQKWIFDNREMPIFEADNEGRCVWVNAAYLTLVGKDMSLITGHGWKNVIAPEDRDRVVHNWELCVKDGRDSEDTYHIIDAKGKRIKVFTAACKTGKFGYVGAVKVIGENE